MQAQKSKQKISKAVVDAAQPRDKYYVLWDAALPGFGLSVAPSGLKAFVLRYRARHKFAPKQFVTLGRLGPLTPEEARRQATALLGEVAQGRDPALESKQAKLSAMTLAQTCDRFVELHLKAKRKPNTLALYTHAIENKIKPFFGHRNLLKISKMDVMRLHESMRDTPVMANRAVAALASIYSWAARSELIGEGFNPAARIEKFREQPKDRYLTLVEIERLGRALTHAETIGFDYAFSSNDPKSKHGAKPGERKVIHSPFAVAAIRLLILTGCRVGEILNLRWREVDLERGLLHLPDSKTGRKTIFLGVAAASVIDALPRNGEYVIFGTDPGRARTDLKRPWEAIRRSASLENVRLHDLRHSFASVGAGAGLGLPIIGKLLGHTQARTTARYAHLADDPLKSAADLVSQKIASTMKGTEK